MVITMANSLSKMRLLGIMVVVFIILDWIFVFMNTTTMIPRRRFYLRELAFNICIQISECI